MSLRLEKGFGVWNLEYRPDFTPAEAGMSRFVKVNKPADFIGREAAMDELERGPSRRLVTLVINADDADAIHDEPVFHAGECVGFLTSGGFAHHIGCSVGLGYIPTHLADGSSGLDGFEVEILGQMRPARLQLEPLYDPAGERMRG